MKDNAQMSRGPRHLWALRVVVRLYIEIDSMLQVQGLFLFKLAVIAALQEPLSTIHSCARTYIVTALDWYIGHLSSAGRGAAVEFYTFVFIQLSCSSIWQFRRLQHWYLMVSVTEIGILHWKFVLEKAEELKVSRMAWQQLLQYTIHSSMLTRWQVRNTNSTLTNMSPTVKGLHSRALVLRLETHTTDCAEQRWAAHHGPPITYCSSDDLRAVLLEIPPLRFC